MVKRSRAEEFLITRKKILDAGRDLFMEKGYRSVSTREIAVIAGITQPALYHHFKDKEMLYLEVVKELTTSIQADMSELIRKNLAPVDALNEMVIMLIDKHPTNILLMIHDILNELKEENQFLLYTLWRDTYLRPFEHVFKQLEARAEIREPISAERAARFFLSAISPLFSQMSKFESAEPTDVRVKETINFILFGLCKKEV
ncbi:MULTISPECIES: TetR/AcrR family transcriptional regulator [Listeria]|uniref:TetR/AcrR family transcriptional regulator n=1 Tax=Listeria TaxID=1637 RepID=UPI000B5964C7|nr:MULTISPECIES: TetR/AcrR family transcriptional regulator [Listeria]